MVEARAGTWQPPPSLGLDQAAIRHAVRQSAAGRQRWLIHPCVVALTDGCGRGASAHAQLAAWVAAHSVVSGMQLGVIALSEDMWLWGRQGPFQLSAGTYPLAEIVKHMSDPLSVAVPDPWGDTLSEPTDIGDLAAGAWWTQVPLTQERQARLAADLRALCTAESALATVLPEAARWLRDVTSVVVPLFATGGATFRSGSIADIPGLVMVEITDKRLLTLEALIHESAHLYFHIAESASPFVVDGHDERYPSPLRRDARPLRGIFLAVHALIHMCAFYECWYAATGDDRCLAAVGELRLRRDDAMKTMRGANRALTASGQRFLDACIALVDARPTL